MSVMPSTLDMISWIAIGYGALVTGLAVFSAWRWRVRPPWLASMVWMLEFLHGVRAVGGLAHCSPATGRRHRPRTSVT